MFPVRTALASVLLGTTAFALPPLQDVPTDVQFPGTQPGEVGELESPNKCDNCHGGYDLSVEPVHNWRGSMMAQATRDPLFWATVAVAEQDFGGAGDLCIRCHSTEGWIGGRSTPTDGTGLRENDSSGVMCDACHKMANPDDSEHLGVQFPPYLANDEGTTPVGYYGSGMYVFTNDNDKLGPYVDPASPHQAMQSKFHRKAEFCGTCHDVSNPVVGDLAPNNGAQVPLLAGTFSGVPGTPVDGKAAFNNFPFQYGIVERTFSEHQSSLLSQINVADYESLPPELLAGSIQHAIDDAMLSGAGGDYLDGTVRTFTCQSCHMRPVTGKGCNKASADVRADIPLHDMTGGNYWTPQAIEYLDGLGRLVIGGGLSQDFLDALDDGAQRARGMLDDAAALDVQGDVVRVVNLTGHKLISGFPEGRRMWLNVKWYDAFGQLLREDGEYGPVNVTLEGSPLVVDTLLDLHDPFTRVYEAHMGISQEWAAKLVSVGFPASLPVAFDRTTGNVELTLGDLAAEPAGSVHESFHFVLNDTVVADNRIPPYGMDYVTAKARNVLPVPETQYGDPAPAGPYAHWDELLLVPPVAAATATIDLLYQPTSWEYVQFLRLANDTSVAHLATTGADILEAWQATGMASPHTMASATWTAPYSDCNRNGFDDPVDLVAGTSADCNANGIPDECDIGSGTSLDRQGAWAVLPNGLYFPVGNGIPDECDGLNARLPFQSGEVVRPKVLGTGFPFLF